MAGKQVEQPDEFVAKGASASLTPLVASRIAVHAKTDTHEMLLQSPILNSEQKKFLNENWKHIEPHLGQHDGAAACARELAAYHVVGSEMGSKVLVRTVFEQVNILYNQNSANETMLAVEGTKALVAGDSERAGTALEMYHKENNKIRAGLGLQPANELDSQKRLVEYAAETQSITREEVLRRYGETIREAARLAGFTSFLSLKDVKGSVAPGFTAMERQVAQNFMLAVNYDLYEIAEEAARKARDKGTEHHEKEPAAARAEEKEEKPKLSGSQVNDMNEFLAKSVGTTPAALTEAAVGQQRVEQGKAPEKEVDTPSPLGGAAALKAPKAVKAKAPKPTAERIRAAYAKVAEYEKRGSAISPDIVPNKFEDQKERAAKTGDTAGLQDYIKLILDKVAADPARFAASAQPKKQAKN